MDVKILNRQLKKANAHSEYSGRAFFAFARLNAQSLRSEVSREALPLQFRKFFFSCIISLFPANLSVKEQSTAAQKSGARKKSKKNISGCIIRVFPANLSVNVFRKTAGNDSGG